LRADRPAYAHGAVCGSTSICHNRIGLRNQSKQSRPYKLSSFSKPKRLPLITREAWDSPTPYSLFCRRGDCDGTRVYNRGILSFRPQEEIFVWRGFIKISRFTRNAKSAWANRGKSHLWAQVALQTKTALREAGATRSAGNPNFAGMMRGDFSICMRLEYLL
jgi:hypothetical protein